MRKCVSRSLNTLPGNDQQIVLDRLGDEFAPRAPGGLGKEIKRAVGRGELVEAAQFVQQKIAVEPVFGDAFGKFDVASRHAGPLDGLRSADERKLLQLDHLLDHVFRTVRVAEPPARHRMRLAETVDDDRPIVPAGRAAEGTVVAERAIDLVADQGDVLLGSQSRQAFQFPSSKTVPVGLPGLLQRMTFVRSVIAARTLSRSMRKSGYVSTSTGLPPTSVVRCLYITKYGSKNSTSSPGLTSTDSASINPPLVPLVTNTLRSRCPYSASTRACSFARSGGNALRLAVSVPPFGHGPVKRLLDRLGRVEMRLPDAEVDRVFHLGRQIEDLANAGSVDPAHPVGDPGAAHDDSPSSLATLGSIALAQISYPLALGCSKSGMMSFGQRSVRAKELLADVEIEHVLIVGKLGDHLVGGIVDLSQLARGELIAWKDRQKEHFTIRNFRPQLIDDSLHSVGDFFG